MQSSKYPDASILTLYLLCSTPALQIVLVPTPTHPSNFMGMLAVPWLPWQQSGSRLRNTARTWKDAIFTCAIYDLESAFAGWGCCLHEYVKGTICVVLG